MTCSDPACTGDHNDRHFATLCPRTREAKRLRALRWYHENPEKASVRAARYRTTAAYMLSQARHDAHRRGNR